MSCTDECRRPRGRREAHCGACHKTFTGPTWFDMHRIGGRCNEIEGLSEVDGLYATAEGHAVRAQSRETLSKFRSLREQP